MYVEMSPGSVVNRAVSRELLKEHLTIYFKYVDQDYHDLKRILGMDPLEVTILRCGTFKGYKDKTGKRLRHINPVSYTHLLRWQWPTGVLPRSFP